MRATFIINDEIGADNLGVLGLVTNWFMCDSQSLYFMYFECREIS